MDTLIPEQSYIRISKPSLSGSLDYKRDVEIFEKIDHILVKEGIENQAKLLYLKYESEEQGVIFDRNEQLHLQLRASQCIRVNIAKSFLGCSFRELSARISDSNLLQWFCRFDCPQTKKLPSKSKLNDLARCIPESLIRDFVNLLSVAISNGLECVSEKIDLSSIYADSTCLKLNIHHPVDWVLIRDAIKSIMKTIKTIRRHNLKHRINPPDSFIKNINQLSIKMTMTKAHRKQDAKKKRKDILREMKALMKVVEQHGYHYLNLLNRSWEKSNLTKNQAQKLSMNLIKILDQVDDIIFQAHERIIGERKVQNKKKILSLYESHAHVYTRGKAGAEVEFGLQFFIAETEQGLIVDWDLRDGKPQNDSKFVRPCIERLSDAGIYPKEFTGDRGFVSPRADQILKDKHIKNHIFPRNMVKLKQKQRQARFNEATNRRSQTEGRIGIIKNCILGGKLKSKGYENQSKQVAWAVLAHNFWVLARMPMEREKKLIA
jgi:hypothetical protein